MLPLGKFLVKVESVTSAKCETNSFCVMACRCRCIALTFAYRWFWHFYVQQWNPWPARNTTVKLEPLFFASIVEVKFFENTCEIFPSFTVMHFVAKKNPFWKICFNLDREYSFTERSFHVSWNWFENKQLDVLTSQIIILWIILHSHEQVQCSEAIILHLQMDIFGINIFQNWNCCLSIFQLFFRHCIVRIIWKENATFSH